MFALKVLKLHSNCNAVLGFVKCFSAFENNKELFTTYFGLSRYTAGEYIEKHKLNRFSPECIQKVIDFCENFGFTKTDILQNPMLLRIHYTTLDHYRNVMTEGGFANITAEILSKFRTHYRKNVEVLKKQGLIRHETNVAESFIKHLNPCPKDFYVETNGDSDIWTDIHLKVLVKYLEWRLEATNDEISNIVKVYVRIQRKSFKYICENIAMALDLGFTREKILKYGYILHAYPKYTKEILEKYPTFAGACMKKAMRMYPKLVNTSPTNVEKIYNILKEHNIPDNAIAKKMNVFHLSPETVNFRLNELKKDDDLKVLLHNPYILKLVVHHNRAKSRLSFLKKLELKCSNVSLLGIDSTKFDIHIREGKDSNSLNDTRAFIQSIFKKDVSEFQQTLKKHPYYLKIPLKSMEETYSYLHNEKFTNSSIFKVIYILLYPKEKIKTALEQVDKYETQNNKLLNQVNKLNLVLYFIEKEHHFTGDGVWTKTECLEAGAQIS